MENNNKSIGIFDSGVGGLTVAKEVLSKIPDESIIYLGDTARVPYGTKSKRTIIKYAESNVNFLLSKGIKILIVACNTASAHAVTLLKEKLEIPVLGVIEPGVKKAAAITKNGKIGIIGTPSTIKSNAYQSKLLEINPELEIFSKACPLFVPIAEEGWQKSDVAMLTTEKYLSELKDSGIDVLILGCTHYPLLKDTISKFMGKNVSLIDSAEETAFVADKILNNENIRTKAKDSKQDEYFLTDTADTFIKVAKNFLGENITEVKVVDII